MNNITKAHIETLFNFDREITYAHKKGEFTFEFHVNHIRFQVSKRYNDSVRLDAEPGYGILSSSKAVYHLENDIKELISKVSEHMVAYGRRDKQREIQDVLGLNDEN